MRLPEQIRSAVTQVQLYENGLYENGRRGFSGINIRRPPGPGTDFTSWQGNLSRVLHSREFQEAAERFEKAHQPGVTFWCELLERAANIPRHYVLGDRRTNGEKAEYVEEVLAAAKRLWKLIKRDLVVSAVEGEAGAPPSLKGEAAMPGHVLLEIHSCPVQLRIPEQVGQAFRCHVGR